MGQLEKYGLYVLVLLAFLIIGVAIWGKPSEAGGGTPNNALSATGTPPKSPAANGGGGQPGGNQPANGITGNPANGGQGSSGTGVTPQARDLSKALQQAPAVEPKKDDANKGGGGGGTDSNKTAGDSGGPTKAPSAEEQKRPDYTVRTGESFERIAREQLGHAGMSGEIAKLNSKIEPTKLRAGQVIALPSRPRSRPGRRRARRRRLTASRRSPTRRPANRNRPLPPTELPPGKRRTPWPVATRSRALPGGCWATPSVPATSRS
ncbi:MAG: LysM peptidoglycan-binding domain-containing protein [Planctomycetes bacterium]|nr:LysM peptidoglycan-binding domain-containing protein [Planctomycetota bacterium]